MKLRIVLLICLVLLFTSCQAPRDFVWSPYWETSPETPENLPYDEVLLTSLHYGKYDLYGDDIPYYHRLKETNAFFSVNGTSYSDGIYISPISSIEEGYIEYDISSVSEYFDTFVCKVGKQDGALGEGDRVIVLFVVDGKLMSRTPMMAQGEDAFLIDVSIPHGAKTLRIECRSQNNPDACATVICDGRFVNFRNLADVSWPE